MAKYGTDTVSPQQVMIINKVIHIGVCINQKFLIA